MMPWNPQLVDKLCKRPKSGLSQSESIINTMGGLVDYADRKNGNKLAIVVTHTQQIAEVLREIGKLDDPAIRFSELSMLVLRNSGLSIFHRGVLEGFVAKSVEAKTTSPFVYSFDQVNDVIISQIGGKAVNLVKLKRAGLSVPSGYCITTELHDYYIANGRLPDGLITKITSIKKVLGNKVAIRSSANCEDGTKLSMAGVFESCYVYQDEEIASAIEKIFRQSRSEEVAQFMAIHGKSVEDVKMGLIIQKLIEPETAGVMYTGINGDNLLIQYTDGFGARLVDGKTSGSAMIVNGSGEILESAGFESRPIPPVTIRQMSVYAGLIEGLFPGVPQDIEFANQNGVVHIALPLVGHFSTGEMLEIRHQPLRDKPEALESYVKGIRQTGQYKEQFDRQKEIRLAKQQSLLAGLQSKDRDELEAVIKSSQTYMALRETVKYLFTKEYLLTRDVLELLDDRLVLEDGNIYFLYPRELPRLVSNPKSMTHLIRARRQSFENYPKLNLPSVIRESDIDGLSLIEEDDSDFVEATGKFLAEGNQVEGVVVNLDEFGNLDDARVVLEQYRTQDIPVILVATQLNLSHDPFISQAAGLVIENAGIGGLIRAISLFLIRQLWVLTAWQLLPPMKTPPSNLWSKMVYTLFLTEK